MSDTTGIFIERVRDEGQWFNRGERVEFFPGTGGRLQPALEKAALGPYEVLGCARVYAEDTHWLDVRLSSVFSTSRLRRRLGHAGVPDARS
jgi:hypothetical protein